MLKIQANISKFLRFEKRFRKDCFSLQNNVMEGLTVEIKPRFQISHA